MIVNHMSRCLTALLPTPVQLEALPPLVAALDAQLRPAGAAAGSCDVLLLQQGAGNGTGTYSAIAGVSLSGCRYAVPCGAIRPVVLNLLGPRAGLPNFWVSRAKIAQLSPYFRPIKPKFSPNYTQYYCLKTSRGPD